MLTADIASPSRGFPEKCSIPSQSNVNYPKWRSTAITLGASTQDKSAPETSAEETSTKKKHIKVFRMCGKLLGHTIFGPA